MTGIKLLRHALEVAKKENTPEAALTFFKIARSYWIDHPGDLELASVIEMIDEEILKYRTIIEERAPCRLCEHFIFYRSSHREPVIRCRNLHQISKKVIERSGCRYKNLRIELHEAIIMSGADPADHALCDSAKGARIK